MSDLVVQCIYLDVNVATAARLKTHGMAASTGDDLRGENYTSRQTLGLVTDYVSIFKYHVRCELRAGLNEVSLVVAGQQCLDRMYESLVQTFSKWLIVITGQLNSSLLLAVTHVL